MTVEQMNRVIAEYMGYTVYGQTVASKHGRKYDFHVSELQYHKDWNYTLKVWQKLRGELKRYGYLYNDQQARIGHAILDTDITTAHRLIVEAIQLIKK